MGKCLRGLGDLGRSAQDTMDDNGFHHVYHFQTIPLSFTFQFYGHEINQVTIATGGRLFPVAAAQGNFGQQLHLLLLLLKNDCFHSWRPSKKKNRRGKRRRRKKTRSQPNVQSLPQISDVDQLISFKNQYIDIIMMHTHAQSSVSGPLPFLLYRSPALSLVLSFVMHMLMTYKKLLVFS